MALLAVCALSLTAVSASAINILLVTNDGTDGAPELKDWLEGMVHTVTQDEYAGGPPADSSFDLIIFCRQSNSGNYDEPNEPPDWTAMTTPQIHTHAWTMRNSRLGWITTTTQPAQPSDAFDAYANLAHPFLAGLTAADTNAFIDSGLVSVAVNTADLHAGTVVVASRNSGANTKIFEIPVGTTFSGTMQGGTPWSGASQGKRYGFLFDQVSANQSQFTNLNATGLTILSNMVVRSQLLPDFDNDGMPDDWENLYTNVNWMVSDANLDPDSDGLLNGGEYANQANPDIPDTDFDGLLDGPEVTGVSNTLSFLATLPNNPDTDGDGAWDGDEVTGVLNTGWLNAPTDPYYADTDFDGCEDLYEINATNIAPGLNPNDFSDGSGDLDGDNLTNAEEFLGTYTGNIQTRADVADTDADGYDDWLESANGVWQGLTNGFPLDATGTSPVVADTDEDGLEDGDENLDLGSYQGTNSFPAWSDPNIPDTDTDGLSDGEEMLVYNTDPQDADTDGDTYDDGFEIVYETDPTDPLSFPSAELLAELRLNFAAIGAATPAGWTNYVAQNENLTTFTNQTFAAFGTNVVVTPVFKNPDGTNSTNNASYQMFTRDADAAAAAGSQELYQHWLSSDNRTEGSLMTLVISNVPAGTYTWTSDHFDPNNRKDAFNVVVKDANGTHVKVARFMAEGDEAQDPAISRFKAVVVSDGTNAISVEFVDKDGPWAGINWLNLRTTEALPTNQPVTLLSADANGVSSLTFTPGGHGYTLNAATNLANGLSREINAVFDATNTFTLPAGYNDGQGYFQTELLPQP